MARRGDVVVVTINHRLGALGYTYLRDAGGEAFAASGNAGMLDIVAALRWVRENIAGFGGDPGRVLIFGESGGGQKVSALLAMPPAKGLFHRAVIESGPGLRMVERDEAARVGKMFLDELGVKPERSCRNSGRAARAHHGRTGRSESQIAADDAWPDSRIRTRGGWRIPASSSIRSSGPGGVRRCPAHHRPQSHGDDALRGAGCRAFSRWTKPVCRAPQTAFEGQRGFGASRFPLHLPAGKSFGLVFPNHHRVSTVAFTEKIAERRAALGKAATYVYEFTWPTPILGGRMRSPHTIEMPFVFNNVGDPLVQKLTGGGADTFLLAEHVCDTWVAFARTGSPNSKNLPHWPAYSAADREVMIINTESRVEKDPDRVAREAIEKFAFGSSA